MFDRTTIQAGPSHVTHEHRQHLAPTAEHLKLLQEYQQQAQAEARQEWFDGNLADIGVGLGHVRRFRLEAIKQDAVDVTLLIKGSRHKLTVSLPDDDIKNAQGDNPYIDALISAVRTQLAAYLVEHVLLDEVLRAALLPSGGGVHA